MEQDHSAEAGQVSPGNPLLPALVMAKRNRAIFDLLQYEGRLPESLERRKVEEA